MTHHTPGPYVLVGGVSIRAEKSPFANNVVAGVASNEEHRGEALANGVLLTAAPELLKWLKHFLPHPQIGSAVTPALIAARALIAKVERHPTDFETEKREKLAFDARSEARDTREARSPGLMLTCDCCGSVDFVDALFFEENDWSYKCRCGSQEFTKEEEA